MGERTIAVALTALLFAMLAGGVVVATFYPAAFLIILMLAGGGIIISGTYSIVLEVVRSKRRG